MDARVAKLEEHVGNIRVDVATMKERLAHTATKAWVLGGTLTGAGIILAAMWWLVRAYLEPILTHLH